MHLIQKSIKAYYFECFNLSNCKAGSSLKFKQFTLVYAFYFADISFVQGTLVLTNHRCPRWAVVNARDWGIPLVSITWLVQSLIEGKILTYDLHKRFKPF